MCVWQDTSADNHLLAEFTLLHPPKDSLFDTQGEGEGPGSGGVNASKAAGTGGVDEGDGPGSGGLGGISSRGVRRRRSKDVLLGAGWGDELTRRLSSLPLLSHIEGSEADGTEVTGISSIQM